jgi:2-methylisocitrate lyase-like PEP mutase family enzyme
VSAAAAFRELHVPGRPLLLPNPWDVGSAKLLASLGFQALATTSSGFAATLGRLDYGVSRDQAIAHGAALAAAVDVPVSADLENGFGDDPAEVAATVRLAIGAGLAGCSIEDSTGVDAGPIYCLEHAEARVRAAVEAAGDEIVITARAENFLHHRPDLDDTIERLRAFAAAGAGCVYAPGVSELDDIRRIVREVDAPVNVLALPDAPPVAELADAGVARISVGGAFAFAAFGGAVKAARELLEQGTYGFWEDAVVGSKAIRRAFA